MKQIIKVQIETISILMNYIVELVDKVDYPLSINDNIDIVELLNVLI